MKNFKGILVLGERNIFTELSQIISIAVEANTILKVMFNDCWNTKTLTENMHAIRDLEKKSDEIAFKLNENITAGAISPNLIDDLIETTHQRHAKRHGHPNLVSNYKDNNCHQQSFCP